MVDAAKPKRVQPTVRQHDLAEELKRQTGQLAAINSVITAVSQSLDLNVTLQTALEAVLSVIPVEASGISLVDEAAGELVLRAQRGWKHDFVTKPMRIKLGQGLSGQAVINDEVVVTGDPSNDPRLYVPAFTAEQIQAQALAPMHARGKVVGILSVMSYQPYQFDTNEIHVLQAIADQVGLALDNARLYESVREEQNRLQAVLQSTADAIIATDNYGIINMVNQAAETLFQVNVDVIIGQPLRDAPLPPLISKKLREIATHETTTGQTFEVLLDNGRCLAAVVSPVYTETQLDERQTTDGWVAVFQDITHLKEAERTRLQFIQTAAHDLRNPLAVTLSALTMLHKTWKNPTDTQQEVFNIALNGINRMQDLIDDMLNLEHIESGVDLRYEPMHIPDLVERCAFDMGPILQRKDQRLALEIDLSLPPFSGDQRWLYRALMNLLSNAHKYTQRESAIILRAQHHDDDLIIQIEDNGPGIPVEAQARLFERFYRVRRTEEKVPGTGLGLAIVKSVVEKHNGRVFVQSEVGKGSIFGMLMPYNRPADPDES
jgi:two-component system phosphate regulon sensor histidine kinase PhoR